MLIVTCKKNVIKTIINMKIYSYTILLYYITIAKLILAYYSHFSCV